MRVNHSLLNLCKAALPEQVDRPLIIFRARQFTKQGTKRKRRTENKGCQRTKFIMLSQFLSHNLLNIVSFFLGVGGASPIVEHHYQLTIAKVKTYVADMIEVLPKEPNLFSLVQLQLSCQTQGVFQIKFQIRTIEKNITFLFFHFQLNDNSGIQQYAFPWHLCSQVSGAQHNLNLSDGNIPSITLLQKSDREHKNPYPKMPTKKKKKEPSWCSGVMVWFGLICVKNEEYNSIQPMNLPKYVNNLVV